MEEMRKEGKGKREKTTRYSTDGTKVTLDATPMGPLYWLEGVPP